MAVEESNTIVDNDIDLVNNNIILSTMPFKKETKGKDNKDGLNDNKLNKITIGKLAVNLLRES